MILGNLGGRIKEGSLGQNPPEHLFNTHIPLLPGDLALNFFVAPGMLSKEFPPDSEREGLKR